MLSVACGRQGHIGLNGSELISSKVVGGSAVSSKDKTFNSVVGLLTPDESGTGHIFCSGNLVSRTEVLTAGHCITDFEMSSREDVMQMITKVLAKIKQEDPNFDENKLFEKTKEQQRALFKDAFEKVVYEDAKKIQLYVGVAAPNSRQTGADVVDRVLISTATMNFMKANFLKKTVLRTAEDDRSPYGQRLDMVRLKLKAGLPGVTPTAVITPDEHEQNVRIGGTVKVVGFGLKVDARYLEGAVYNIRVLQDKIKTETDASIKATLQSQLVVEYQAYLQYRELYLASGNKNQVDLKLENYDHTAITLTSKVRGEEHGACSGDSGGPAFVQIADGSYRQIGVVVTVDVCGNKTHVAPIFDLKR